MALRSLMLGKKLSEKKKSLDEIRQKISGFEAREAELAQAIEEASTDEEKATVEEAVEEFEKEKAEAEEAEKSLDAEVRELETELDAVDAKEEPVPEARAKEAVKETREKEIFNMKKRFRDMSYAERTAFVQQDEVQSFLGEVRTAIKEKRAISNAGYLIPQVILGLIKENIEEYSKLYGRVDLRQVAGTSRVVIEGAYPEAVWT